MTRPGASLRFLLMCFSGLAVLIACSPRARPLTGESVPAVLPAIELPGHAELLRFSWNYKDDTFEARGDGAVRIQGPDSARLDFFLSNGMSGGYAILIADDLRTPGGDLVRRLLPPTPLLWAALGRLAVPPTKDTVARKSGEVIRADMGSLRGGDASNSDGRAWRVSIRNGELQSVERIEGGRIMEWVDRRHEQGSAMQVRYVHERGRRRLSISVISRERVSAFDAAIWHEQQSSNTTARRTLERN